MTIAPSVAGSYLPPCGRVSVNRKRYMEDTYKGPSVFGAASDLLGAQTLGFVIFGGMNVCILEWKSLLGFGAL